jgi:hypothetical protein
MNPGLYMGFESPPLRHILQGNSEADTQLGTQAKVVACPQLAQVVSAWVKLPAPLKAAILAIVNTATNERGQ